MSDSYVWLGLGNNETIGCNLICRRQQTVISKLVWLYHHSERHCFSIPLWDGKKKLPHISVQVTLSASRLKGIVLPICASKNYLYPIYLLFSTLKPQPCSFLLLSRKYLQILMSFGDSFISSHSCLHNLLLVCICPAKKRRLILLVLKDFSTNGRR